jgi:hypothetical protein
MLTFVLLKKVGPLHSRVGAEAGAGAESKYLYGAGA